jgi:hypothetical protein
MLEHKNIFINDNDNKEFIDFLSQSKKARKIYYSGLQ